MKKSLGAKSLVFPSPVWCIGTYDKNGAPNVMTIAWGGICCSKPPCVTISLRKATLTYSNIMERQAYTISVPSERYAKEADYFGTVSGRNVDKFQETKLTAIKSILVDAPYIEQFPMILECKVIHSYEIGLHTQFIGQIMDIKVDATVLTDNLPDMEKVKPFVYGAETRSYYSIGKQLGRAFKIGKKI